MSAARNPILLAEDDPNDVLLLRRAFRGAGLPEPELIVSDGDAAIAYLKMVQALDLYWFRMNESPVARP